MIRVMHFLCTYWQRCTMDCFYSERLFGSDRWGRFALSQYGHIERQGTPNRADPKTRTFSKASCETMGQFPGVPFPISMGTREAQGPIGAVVKGALTLPPTLHHYNQENHSYSEQCNPNITIFNFFHINRNICLHSHFKAPDWKNNIFIFDDCMITACRPHALALNSKCYTLWFLYWHSELLCWDSSLKTNKLFYNSHWLVIIVLMVTITH